MRIEGSEVTTLITGVVVLFSALAASSNKKFQSTAGSAAFFQRSFISKLSVVAEFILYLPAATEFGVTFQNPLRVFWFAWLGRNR
jgi:hypothetical protein